MATLLIDPDETLDYTLDWATWLAETGSPADTITMSAWAVSESAGSPSQPTLSGESNTTSTATVFISGCQLAEIYQLTNTITTGQGRTAERSLTLRCEQR